MSNKKNVSLVFISLLTIFVVVIYFANSATKVYAEEDAPVVTANTATTRKAPVSITTYSNVITESSDTYNYRKQPVTGSQIDDNNTVPATPAPTEEVQQPATEQPQTPVGTGSPDATAEPDIISYPPTVAPPYTD